MFGIVGDYAEPLMHSSAIRGQLHTMMILDHEAANFENVVADIIASLEFSGAV